MNTKFTCLILLFFVFLLWALTNLFFNDKPTSHIPLSGMTMSLEKVGSPYFVSDKEFKSKESSILSLLAPAKKLEVSKLKSTKMLTGLSMELTEALEYVRLFSQVAISYRSEYPLPNIVFGSRDEIRTCWEFLICFLIVSESTVAIQDNKIWLYCNKQLLKDESTEVDPFIN
jgi:hypothetical protein